MTTTTKANWLLEFPQCQSSLGELKALCEALNIDFVQVQGSEYHLMLMQVDLETVQRLLRAATAANNKVRIVFTEEFDQLIECVLTKK